MPYRIVEVAPTGQLFAAPRHPCTRALLAAIPRLTSSLDGTGPPAIARSPRVPDYQAACHFAFGQVPDNAAGTPVTNVAGEGGSGRR